MKKQAVQRNSRRARKDGPWIIKSEKKYVKITESEQDHQKAQQHNAKQFWERTEKCDRKKRRCRDKSESISQPNIGQRGLRRQSFMYSKQQPTWSLLSPWRVYRAQDDWKVDVYPRNTKLHLTLPPFTTVRKGAKKNKQKNPQSSCCKQHFKLYKVNECSVLGMLLNANTQNVILSSYSPPDLKYFFVFVSYCQETSERYPLTAGVKCRVTRFIVPCCLPPCTSS